MEHLTIVVTGRVQGVYFRQHAQAEAKRLGLTGLARNEPDGSVYIEAEGKPTALQQFVQWCQDGSPQATVDRVQQRTAPVVGYQDFTTH